MSGRNLVLLLVGVCALSAAIGAGTTLIVQDGPQGPPGERGPPGPRGPEGPVGSVDLEDIDVEALEAKLTELEEALEGLELLGIDVGDLNLSEVESTLCDQVGILC